MTGADRSDRVAELIARRRSAPRRALAPVDNDGPAPLSTIQLGLWTLEAMAPGQGSTNRPTAARLRGPLYVDALGWALDAIVERHEPLRTVYPFADEEPVQVVIDDVGVDLARVDVAGLGRVEQEEELRRVLEEARQVSLDPARQVQFAATLLTEAPESHVLVVSLNHLAFDGWSETVFWSDLLELYRARLHRDRTRLAHLPIRFGDYARWERHQAAETDLDESLGRWQEMLAGLGQAPALPDGGDPTAPYELVTVALAEAEMQAVRDLSRAERTTPFVVLLAGVELASRELLDAEDFLTRCPIAGRDRPEVHDLVGCFINHLYIRSGFRDARTHAEHLRAVRSRVAAAMSGRAVPNRRVLELFGSWSRRPELARVSFQWRDFPRRLPADGPLDIELIHMPDRSDGLSVYVTPRAHDAELVVQYDPGRFTNGSASEWAGRLREHVSSLCADRARPIGPLRPRCSRPDPTVPLVPEKIERVSASIARQVRLAPDADAVLAGPSRLTYRELWDRSSSLAGALIGAGVAPGDPIAILCERTPGYVVAMLGCLRAGAVAVPLDSELPVQRLGLMASVAGARRAVVVGEHPRPDDTGVATWVRLHPDGRLVDGDHHALDRVDVEPLEDRAYVFFTSGTTAEPKGVLGTHTGLAHFLAWERARLGVTPTDQVAGVTGPSFDVALRELFLPLTSGATLVLAEPGIRPDRGLRWLRESGATIVHITPSLAGAWLAEDGGVGGQSRLRWTLFAGERLRGELVNRWRSAVGAGRIMNLYGPTETCMVKAAHEIGPVPGAGVQPVGHPLPHSQLLVVDGGRLCQPGEDGEVVIRTAVGTAGYLGDRSGGFVGNPLAPGSDDIVYLTGDRGRYGPDWAVTVDGRFDDQVKIDGIRVEPDETADILRRHPGVADCAVLAVEFDDGTRLAGFVVPAGPRPSDRELRQHLRDWVRTSSIPSTFTAVERIPLTTNGKTDRRALLALGVGAGATDATPVAPPGGTTLAEIVIEAWKGVLGVEAVDDDADFFALGGTSLRALRIMARIEADTGIAVPIDLFFDSPTIREFAGAVAALGGADAEPAGGDVERAGPGDDVAPSEGGATLSFSQERMWVDEQRRPGTFNHVMRSIQRVRGPLDVDALGRALSAVVARHDVLRTRVATSRGQPQAIIDPPWAVGVEHHDVRDLDGPGRDSAVEAFVRGIVERPFGLATDHLVRAGVIRISDQEWVVALAFHHIVMDGQSYDVLFAELEAHYVAAVAGTVADLAPEPLQFPDYAAEQRRLAESGAFDGDLEYWEQVIGGALPTRSLGTPQPGGADDVAVSARRPVEADLVSRLGRMAAQLRVTPYMLALTCWAAVLCDEADDDEVIVAGVVSDQARLAQVRLLGPALNTVPLRLTVAAGASLGDVAGGIRQTVLGAYEHGRVPLELILDRLGRSSGDPVVGGIDFDLIQGEGPGGGLGLGSDLEVTPYPHERVLLKFDLSAVLASRGADSFVRVKARSSRFGAGDVGRVADAFAARLEAALDDPEAPLRRVRPEPVRHLVPDRVGRWLSEEPERVAVEAVDSSLTRAGLDRRAGVIAAALHDAGIGVGDRVVLAVRRSPDAVAAMYAIWRLGATYVPIDVDHPRSRLETIVADCAPAVLLTDDPALQLAGAPQLILPDADTEGVARPVARTAEARDSAYVIHTSGSSGHPKGVVVSHGALAAFAEGVQTAYGVDERDRCLQFHSLAFDASVEEIHAWLAAGATVVLRPDDLVGSAQRFLRFVEERQLTVVALPTSFWSELTHQMIERDLAVPASVRMVVIGGEAASADDVRAWRAHTDTPLVNSYGPTETTVSVLAGRPAPGPHDEHVSIGRPFATVTAAVVDSDGNEVAPGEWGELVVSGPQLADGYLGAPEATAAAFVDRSDGQRWYRTGDRARWRPDGEVELAGRLDDQVEVDGHRIEPAEIEAALRSLAGVTDAVVVLTTGARGTPHLQAAVTAAGPADPKALRRALTELLPAPMLPRRVHVLEELPRASGGKIDRHQLRTLLAGEEPTQVGADPGMSATAHQLARLWAELLEVDHVGPHSDFFELGGRSLTAVRLAYLIEEELGVSLPVAAIFERPTVAGLSALIDGREPGRADSAGAVVAEPAPVPVIQATSTPAAVAPPSVPPAASEPASLRTGPVLTEPARLHLDRAPLSFAQQRLWLHQQLHPGALDYLIPVRFRLRGPLDDTALDVATGWLVARNEILRTRIVLGADARPTQVIDPVHGSAREVGAARISRVQLDHVDPRQRLSRAEAMADRYGETRIDLSVDHPFDAQLIQLSPTDHLLTFRFHHIAIDDDGIALALRDLSRSYAAALTGADAPEPVPLQYADFAVWQRAQLAEGTHEDSMQYWREKLGDSPEPVDLPGRLADPTVGGTVVHHEVDLPTSVSRRLLELAQRRGVSPFQLLVALTTAVLHRVTGTDDVILGAPGTERRRATLADMVGLFVNTVIIRSRTEPSWSFSELLGHVRRSVGEAIDHSGVPYDALLDDLGIERGAAGLPLVRVLCVMSEQSGSDPLTLRDLDIEAGTNPKVRSGSVADLMVRGRLKADGRLEVTLRHDDGVLESWVMAQLARAVGHLAATVAADPDRPLASIPPLDDAEAHWLAVELNRTEVAFPADTRLEETFAQVAATHPAAIAVRDGDRSISYHEIELEAAGLAAKLTQLGVRRGDRVAVELERSAELVVALVGILQAGAVYLPMDPTLPPARRAQVLELGGAGAVVTLAEGRGLQVEPLDPPNVNLPSGESDPAYVMFTSGSTGVPKGVVVSHRAVQRTVHGIEHAELDPTRVVAMASNPAFDALTFEVWGPLLNGAAIEVIDADTLGDPAAFASYLRARGVTTMFLTASLANLVVANEPGAFCSLDTLIVGGEALDVDTTRALVARGPRRLVNGYGPTECTTFSAWYHVENVPDRARSIPIGGPCANTELHVLDGHGDLVRRGVPGELCIAGPGLAAGYLGDAALTAARFVDVELAGRPIRVYRTGDIVRRLDDGVIEYLGRLDQQVKLRGHRIELTGIEATLGRLDGVAGAAVRLFGTGPHRRLVAFVVPTPGARFDEAAVRARLAEQLPVAMVPSAFVELDQLPLTASGKLDRLALSEPAAAPATAEPESLGPIERSVAELWRSVLGQGPVGLDEDFFERGGNSLLAVELLTRIEQEHGAHIRLSALFDARTPRQLAALIRAESGGADASARRHLVTLREGDLATTPLWLVHPAGGSLVLYEPTVGHMGPGRRILGVEAAGLDGVGEPATTVAAAADHQHEVISVVQPHGPYRIVGYSVGGVIALEVARRLLARGETVELLGAIEGGVPSGPRVEPARLERYRALVRQGDVGGIARTLAAGLRGRADQARRRLDRSTHHSAHARVLRGMVRAYRTYIPVPVEVAVVLFLGDESSGVSAARLVDRWRALATGGVSVRRITGAHYGDTVLREPNAKVLAAALEEELDACDRRHGP